MQMDKKSVPCATCGKQAAGDCSRVECARREKVSARVGDARGHIGVGQFRAYPTKGNQ